MTKEEFLAGKEFVGTLSVHNQYRFHNSSPDIATIGYIEIRNGIFDTWTYYANVEKVSFTNVNLYMSGINKMYRESLKLTELEMTGE